MSYAEVEKGAPGLSLDTTSWGGMGYAPSPQTYTQEAMPSWMRGGTLDLAGQGYQGMGGISGGGKGMGGSPQGMQGAPQGGLSGAGKGMANTNWYQMPQWGTSAATGQPLTQEDLQPQQYQPPAAQEQQAAAAAQQQAAPQQPLPTAQSMWQNNRGYVDALRGAGQAGMQGDWNSYLSQRQAAQDAKRQQMEMMQRWKAGERGYSGHDALMERVQQARGG
jgi:hypothetical protein